MNPVLLQFLAQKSGLSVEQLMAVETDGISPEIDAIKDPLIATMLQVMHQRQFEGEKEERDEEGPDYEELFRRAQRRTGYLKQRLLRADSMLRYIGETFGACSICWGTNAQCSQCQGKGKPGTYTPVEEDMITWAEPALNKLGYRIMRPEQ